MTARSLALGWLLAMMLAVVGRADAQPRWPVTVERDALVVHAEAGLERAARRVADRAPRTLTRISDDLPGLPRPAQIEIRIVADSSALAAAAPADRGAPRWAAGVAYPDLGIVVLALGRGGARHDLDKTLDHELAHLALGAAVPDAPRWLHEGFAWQHAADLDWSRIETLSGMAWFGSVIPLDQLEWTFPSAEQPASRAYAESYDFVGFLARRGRYADRGDDGDRYPFQDFLRELSQGRTVDQAAIAAYGTPIDELFAEWKSDLSRRYLMIPATVFATGLWLLAAVLLIIGWWRRRRRSRQILAHWAAADAAADAARAAADAPAPDAASTPTEPSPDPDEPGRWLN